jgi:hypothetical protein
LLLTGYRLNVFALSEYQSSKWSQEVSESRKQLNTIIGLATVGGGIIGIAGFVAALVAFFSGDFVATGLCLVAAALSFGLLANAVLRE